MSNPRYLDRKIRCYGCGKKLSNAGWMVGVTITLDTLFMPTEDFYVAKNLKEFPSFKEDRMEYKDIILCGHNIHKIDNYLRRMLKRQGCQPVNLPKVTQYFDLYAKSERKKNGKYVSKYKRGKRKTNGRKNSWKKD